MEPVSYTHLDVYKRQTSHWPRRLPQARRLGEEPRHRLPRIVGTLGNALAYDDRDSHLATEPTLKGNMDRKYLTPVYL